MSGMRCLGGRRAPVESCPWSWTCPTSEDDARYDSPSHPAGFPGDHAAACLSTGASRVSGLRLPSCLPRPRARRTGLLAKRMGQCCLQSVNLGVRHEPFEAVPALQGARSPLRPQDTLSTLRPSCSPCLNHHAPEVTHRGRTPLAFCHDAGLHPLT
jgi:hypothetical protein